MELLDAKQHFKKAVAFLEGHLDGQPHERNLDKAERIINEILNFNVGNTTLLFALGSLHADKGNYGLAVQILSQLVARDHKFGEAWNNLGLAYKSLCDFDRAEQCLEKAAKFIQGHALADIYCNLAAINLNRWRAEKAIPYIDKALEIEPGHIKSIWHRGLALLELRQWAEGWDCHEARLAGGAPEEIAVRNYHGPDGMTPQWDGKSPGTVVIHGEQGMGDEVMFATCIPDAIKTGANIIFEPSPRMEAVFKRAFPEIKVFGTNDTDGRAWIGELGKPDFKIGLGSLPKFFRRKKEDFPGSPYLQPDRDKRAWWSDKIKALGRRPNIGIAWQGGVASTRYDARSFHPSLFAPMFQAVDANWISLQYDPTAQHCVNEVKESLGVKIHHWPKAVEQRNPETGKANNDLDDLVALISRLDMVVSVCQTAIHIAGALGVPCLCLTPSEPSWRYGAVNDEDMPWYASVRLLRQAKGTKDWEPVIQRAVIEVQEYQSIIRTVSDGVV